MPVLLKAQPQSGKRSATLIVEFLLMQIINRSKLYFEGFLEMRAIQSRIRCIKELVDGIIGIKRRISMLTTTINRDFFG